MYEVSDLYYLILNALVSVAQSSIVFDHEYFLNSLSEINNKNIDSIKIYSGSMDNKDSLVLLEVYVFRNEKIYQVIDRKKTYYRLLDKYLVRQRDFL